MSLVLKRIERWRCRRRAAPGNRLLCFIFEESENSIANTSEAKQQQRPLIHWKGEELDILSVFLFFLLFFLLFFPFSVISFDKLLANRETKTAETAAATQVSVS